MPGARHRRAAPRVRTLYPVLVFAVVLAGCGERSPTPHTRAAAEPVDSVVSVVDDAGLVVSLPRPAARVVSLVPSITETLFALGASEQVVGRTDFDTAPETAHLPSVGGGLDPSLETLVSLRPDLVVTWEEEKNAGLRERLDRMGIPVFAMRTRDTTDVFRNVQRMGRLTGRSRAADSVAAGIRAELAAVRASVAGRPTPSVLYVVWNDPPMTAGPHTFIAQVIGVAGGKSIFPDVRQDWPQVAMEEIVRRQPDVVVLPVGEDRAHAADRLRGTAGWGDVAAVRQGHVVEVPTDLMNRPGPYLGRAARAMRDALHPTLREH